MKSAIEDISTVKKKIKIDVAPEDIAAERAKELASLVKKAAIPGFRPGKAPKAVVERHYGDSIKADVINKMIMSSYTAAVKEHSLKPVTDPEIADLSLDQGTALSFSATVEVRPVIALGSYDGIEVAEPDMTVSDAEIDQTINRLREMYARLEVVEGRAVEKADTLVIDFEGFREGKSIEGAKAVDHMLNLGEGSLIPGFEEQLLGMQKAETKEINVTFPGDYANKDLAGKDARFTVTLKEIKKAVMPELNDEFAQEAGGHTNLEDLRKRLREDLEVRKRSERDSAQREEVLGKLVEAHSFEVPFGMVDQELMAMMRQQATRLARQGVDIKDFDAVKFREERKEIAEKRIRGLLILDAIAEKENVTAGDQEMSAEVAALAKSAGQTVAAVRNYYESLDGGLENLRSSLVQQKTLALLLSRTKKVYN